MERRAQAAESLLGAASGQDLLEYAIKAADLYMQAASEATTKTDAFRLRRKCKELIAFAERAKLQLEEVLSTEKGILQNASRLHGSVFPPWESDPPEPEFQLGPNGASFTDDTVFSLSSAQAENFASWSRPGELFDLVTDGQDSLMEATAPSTLVQDMTTDCSVVASLSAAMNVLTGSHLVLSSIIYPFDHEKGRPSVSQSGKYILRLHFNGCPRRVVIDDRLPVSHSDRTLYVVDRRNPRLLWPALLEKAYLKVRGGYDFPGSNSGTDLWVLTGWIPEQLFLQREDLNIDETWERIKEAHKRGDVVITLGTGRISREEEEIMGLIGEHDYAVQKLDESNGLRSLLVRNPWSAGPVWKGAGWVASPRLGGSPSSFAPEQGYSYDASEGALWLTLEDVAQNFESMYLNWNPKLFSRRLDRHFHWKLPPQNLLASAVKNPQFFLQSKEGGPVWILVSRHFLDAELDIARNSYGTMASVSRRLGFMSILIFDNGGQRVQVTGGEMYRGPHVDSPQTLARLDAEPGKRYTVVLDQHEFPLPSYTFTLSAFSQHPILVKEAKEAFSHVKELTGTWSRRTAGGNATSTTYFLNPQFSLTISRRVTISILISTQDREVPVHVDLLWAGGKRAMSIKFKDLLATSGDYRRGCAAADVPTVDPGVYTVVCSTFDPGQTANFTLRIASMGEVGLEPVPPPAAGRLRTPLRRFGLVHSEEARRAALHVSRLTRASVSAQSALRDGSHRIPDPQHLPRLMRLSVVRGWGSDRVVIAESGDGEFQDLVTTLRTPEFDIEPERAQREGIWLVIENIGCNTHDESSAFTLEGELFSEWPVEIGEWEVT